MVEQGNSKIGFVFYVRYLDHVLFKNTDSDSCRPVVREVVGWLAKESDEAIWIVSDRSAEKISNKIAQPCESGLVILKSDMREMKKIGQLFRFW